MHSPRSRIPLTVHVDEKPLRVESVSGVPAARVSLAASLLKVGHYELAEREVRIALHQNPESTQGHLVLALIEMYQSKLDEATTRLNLALRLDRSNAQAWLALAQAHSRRQDPKAALPAIDEAIRCCEEPGDRTDMLVFRGEILTELERIDEARLCLEQALEQDPTSDGACRAMARLLAGRKEWSAARKYAKRAIRLQPLNSSVRQVLGDAMYESGEAGSALCQYTLSLLSSSQGYRRAAAKMQEQGYAEEALALLRMSIVCHPGEIETYLELARMYVKLNRPGEAIALCQAALLRQPDHADTREFLDDLQAGRAAS